MTDRREDILRRLVMIADGIAGVETAKRNLLNPTDDNLPAVIIFDGDETADSADPMTRPPNAPRRVTMTPEIEIRVQADKTDVGTDLNAIRLALIKAIVADATLITLTLDGAQRNSIRFLGSETGLASGRMIEGSMSLHFEFTYRLLPDEF